MPEPKRLRVGKEFQRVVQADFEANSLDGIAGTEKTMELTHSAARQKTGRMDILVDDLGDFVTVLEIKATDWDRIKPKNVTRNLYRHQRQLLLYVEQYIQVDKTDVCLGIIYPRPPRTKALRERITRYLEDYGIPARAGTARSGRIVGDRESGVNTC